MDKEQYLSRINELQTLLRETIQNYWQQYSSFDTLGWWISLFTLLIPLIILYFLIDRKKIFIVCFYGYTYHVIVSYLDSFMNRYNFWEYPYFSIPFLSANFPIDAALLPISYLLLYQWTTNKHKNFYIYSFLLSVFFGIIYAGLLERYDLFRLTNGMNNFYLLLIDYGMALIAFWITSIFLYAHKKTMLN